VTGPEGPGARRLGRAAAGHLVDLVHLYGA
jgi:hypothetical protein